MTGPHSQIKKKNNVENSAIQNNVGVKSPATDTQATNTDNSQAKIENSKDIYKEVFEGKIYTFYSLNLRHLFTSEIEEKLDKRLETLLKSKKTHYKDLLNSKLSENKEDYDKTKQRVTKIIEKLLELRRNANLFLASKDYNYFAKNLEILEKDSTEYENATINFVTNMFLTSRSGKIFKKKFDSFADYSEEYKKFLDKYAKKLKDDKDELKNKFDTNNKIKPFLVYEDKLYVIEDKSEDLKNELKNGILLSIFRHNLTEDWLGGNYFKIYGIDKDKLKNVKENKLEGEKIEDTSTPAYYIRLSKLGVLEIRKEENYSSKSTLRGSMETLVGYEDRNSFKGKEIAEITFNFCKCIEAQLHQAFKLSGFHKKADKRYREIKAKTWKQLFQEKKEYADIPSLTRLDRQRYIVIVINDVDNISKDKEQEYISEQALTILEGRFLKKGKDSFVIPKVVNKTNVPNVPKDMSTWADELCFFSAERSLIYFTKDNANAKYFRPDNTDGISYKNYWDCIIRGIEFSCLIRMALRIIESTSRKMVQHIPDRLIDFDDENFEDIKNKVRLLEIELAHFLEIVPEIRSASNAINSFRSERNVKKFNVLQDECFGFEEILKNIQKNIDDLTYFVSSFKQRVLQRTVDDENKRKEEVDRKLNILALLFTATAILYVFPSFVHDFSEWDWIKVEGLSITLAPNSEFWLTFLFIIILLLLLRACVRLWNNPNYWLGNVLKYFFPANPTNDKTQSHKQPTTIEKK